MSVVLGLLRPAVLAVRQSAWRSTARTKAYLTLDAPAIAADINAARGRQKGEDAAETLPPSEQSLPDDEHDAVDGPSGSDRGGDESPFDVGKHYGRRKQLGFVFGPAAFGFIALSPTPTGLGQSGEAVAAVTAWVTIWWMSEAVPIPATLLSPIVLFPATGALPVAATVPSYADPLVLFSLPAETADGDRTFVPNSSRPVCQAPERR
jgi:Sodium:sulfate symporter transmembrane region.